MANYVLTDTPQRHVFSDIRTLNTSIAAIYSEVVRRRDRHDHSQRMRAMRRRSGLATGGNSSGNTNPPRYTPEGLRARQGIVALAPTAQRLLHHRHFPQELERALEAVRDAYRNINRSGM